jgi:hypothetical protein
MTSRHALRLPTTGQDHDLDVQIDGDLARLELRSRPGAGDPDAPDPVEIEVSARALVAALRAAWADEHDAPTFEPWRDADPRDVDRYRWYGPRGVDDLRDGDLGDGDPDGFGDASVVPFPASFPRRPSAPARSGLPWEPEEEARIRKAWLGASPDADRDDLLAAVAGEVERGIGGVTIRLRQVGCDPARPGCLLERLWDVAPGPGTAGADEADGADAG